MGKAEKEQLNRILTDHLNTIHETLQVQFHTLTVYVFCVKEVLLTICNLGLFDGDKSYCICMQALDQTAAPSLDKISWDEVIKMAEQVSKQATMGIVISFLLSPQTASFSLLVYKKKLPFFCDKFTVPFLRFT